MNHTSARIPNIITAIYVTLVLLSAIPIFTGGDALSGVFAIVLTAPWSAMLGSLLPGNMMSGLLVVAVGAAINAAIIYYVSRWLVGKLAG